MKVRKDSSVSGPVVIDRQATSGSYNRHFYVIGGSLEMEGVTLTGGYDVSFFCCIFFFFFFIFCLGAYCCVEILKRGRMVCYICLTFIFLCSLFFLSRFSFFCLLSFAPMCLVCGVFVHFFVLCVAPLVFLVLWWISFNIFYIFDVFGLCLFFAERQCE